MPDQCRLRSNFSEKNRAGTLGVSRLAQAIYLMACFGGSIAYRAMACVRDLTGFALNK